MKVLRILLAFAFLLTFEKMYADYEIDVDTYDGVLTVEATGTGDDTNFEALLAYDIAKNAYTQQLTLYMTPIYEECGLFAVKFRNNGYLYALVSINTTVMENILIPMPVSYIELDLTRCYCLTGAGKNSLQPLEAMENIFKGNNWKIFTIDEILNLYSNDAVTDMYINGKSIYEINPDARHLDMRKLFREFAQELRTVQRKPATAPTKRTTTPPANTQAAQTKTTYRLPAKITPYDVITKPFGLSLNQPYTAEKLKSALTSCGIKYTQTKTGELETKNIPFTLYGKKPTSWKTTPRNSSGIPLQVFNFTYPTSVWNRTQAISFAKSLVEDLEKNGYKFADYSENFGADFCKVCVVNFKSGKYRFDVMVRQVSFQSQPAYSVTIGTMPIK